MAYNGAGVFDIDTAGQPVVAGTTIDATVFNALTTDLASGLSTAICKDGQSTPTANIPMATYKFTGLGYGTDATDSARIDNCNVLNMCEGRLTLTSGTPVTTSDVTAAETLYFTPFKGNRIALYDGSKWVMRTFTELSIDVPDVTGVHDVFAYDSSGTVTLEVLVWTNDTTRATALTTQDGVLVKTGATTRRYLGTFYSTTAGNGQTEDSQGNRYLWNYYNRVWKPLRVISGAANWNYTTATWRQWNADASYQANFVLGASEDLVHATVNGAYSNSSANVAGRVGIALDGTGSPGAYCFWANLTSQVANIPIGGTATFDTTVAVGKHYAALVEYSAATGTGTFYGVFNDYKTGLFGRINC